jgi:putative ABC transport system permease protein
MINHYFKLAKKVLIKNKYYTIINVFGLVCGMLSALIIAKYIGGSLYYDNFHVKKERIYTVTQEETADGSTSIKGNSTYWGLGEIIRQYPEVISLTRYQRHVASLVMADGEKNDKVSFIENRIFAADSNFLEIFTFPFVHGNPETALFQDNSIVLTKSTSEKYFGNANPMGKILARRVSWGAETMYKVTGVIEDIPQRSQFRFDFLVSQSPLNSEHFWDVPEYATYVLLKERAKIPELEEKLTGYLNKVAPLKQRNKEVTISLASIANRQLTSIEYLLVVVGLFILFISWVNFINQSIAQSYGRFKEIGILRVMGATRANLKTQFIFESSLVCISSLIIIISIYLGLEPSLQSFTDGHLLPLIGDPTFINFAFLAIFIFGAILVAAIPSIVLFSRNITPTLQKGFSGKIGSVRLRKALVILQFSISVILMISIVVITNQLEYMNTKEKGINIENTIIVRSPMEKNSWGMKTKNLELFKEKCKERPFVIGISSSATIPGEEYRRETFLSLGDQNEKTLVYLNAVDDHFLELYEVKFVAGNDFTHDAPWKNRRSIILNESAAHALGITDFDKMLKTKIIVDGDAQFELVGIVKNYHKTSLKYEIRPMAFKFNASFGQFSLKIRNLEDNNQMQKKLSGIKDAWGQVYPDNPFNFFFLADRFKSQDKQDIYFGKLFKIFTFLSIVISCLGLFGFSLLVSMKRLREIGVRKVFGASATDILVIFFKGYLGSLGVATIIGIPIAYSLMTFWLSNYAYRIEIGFWSISYAVLSLTLIFLFTVSYHTIKSSTANPATVLRD